MVRYTCKGYWWKISTDESPSFWRKLYTVFLKPIKET
jgi:hypothetical protein